MQTFCDENADDEAVPENPQELNPEHWPRVRSHVLSQVAKKPDPAEILDDVDESDERDIAGVRDENIEDGGNMAEMPSSTHGGDANVASQIEGVSGAELEEARMEEHRVGREARPLYPDMEVEQIEGRPAQLAGRPSKSARMILKMPRDNVLLKWLNEIRSWTDDEILSPRIPVLRKALYRILTNATTKDHKIVVFSSQLHALDIAKVAIQRDAVWKQTGSL
jgi:hypothetical protein